MVATEEKKEREAALAKARQASEKMKEEVEQLRERTASAEETASKAWEEAAHYKGVATKLDMEKCLIKSDLASAREAYREIKEECVKSAAEEVGKKTHEDLEAERIRSRGLSDNIDRLKKMLLEKEGAILQAGKLIEDLRVANTNLARSYEEIESDNTDLVGENTALKERIRDKFLHNFRVSFIRYFSCVA